MGYQNLRRFSAWSDAVTCKIWLFTHTIKHGHVPLCRGLYPFPVAWRPLLSKFYSVQKLYSALVDVERLSKQSLLVKNLVAVSHQMIKYCWVRFAIFYGLQCWLFQWTDCCRKLRECFCPLLCWTWLHKCLINLLNCCHFASVEKCTLALTMISPKWKFCETFCSKYVEWSWRLFSSLKLPTGTFWTWSWKIFLWLASNGHCAQFILCRSLSVLNVVCVRALSLKASTLPKRMNFDQLFLEVSLMLLEY